MFLFDSLGRSNNCILIILYLIIHFKETLRKYVEVKWNETNFQKLFNCVIIFIVNYIITLIPRVEGMVVT